MKKKLYIFCSAAMSSSLIAKKMQEKAEAENIDIEVAAFPEAQIKEKAKDADVILLSPQIRYKLDGVKADFPNKTVYLIEMTDYIPTKAGDILTKCLSL